MRKKQINSFFKNWERHKQDLTKYSLLHLFYVLVTGIIIRRHILYLILACVIAQSLATVCQCWHHPHRICLKIVLFKKKRKKDAQPQ